MYRNIENSRGFAGFVRKIFSKGGSAVAGFTLTELIVSIAIVSVIMTVVLLSQSEYTDGIALSNLAEEISLTVSQTQVYSVGVREFSAGSGEFSASFGVVFSFIGSGDNHSYIYFADRDGSGHYSSSWSCPVGGSSECLEKVEITRGNSISSICSVEASGSGFSENCGLGRVDITFSRPNTDATLKFYTMGGSEYSDSDIRGAKIVLESPKGQERSVTVYSTGQVSVQ